MPLTQVVNKADLLWIHKWKLEVLTYRHSPWKTVSSLALPMVRHSEWACRQETRLAYDPVQQLLSCKHVLFVVLGLMFLMNHSLVPRFQKRKTDSIPKRGTKTRTGHIQKLLNNLKRVKLYLCLHFVRVRIKVKTISLLSLGYPREDKLKRTRSFTRLELQGKFLPVTGQWTHSWSHMLLRHWHQKFRVDWN